MRLTLLGFTITDGLLDAINQSDQRLATQTHRFAWGLVSALRSNHVDVDLISAAPVSDYPANPCLFWRRESFAQSGVSGLLLPFINLVGLKHLTRFASAWLWGLRRLRNKRPDWLMVHGVHSPFLWFAVLAAPRLRIKVCVVLTDPPGVVLPGESTLRAALKRIDIAVTKAALQRADAVIVLAEPLATDFAAGVRHLSLEGLFDATAWPEQAPTSSELTPATITYAGGLDEQYGVQNLVDAVRQIDDFPLRLALYGRGPLERDLTDIAAIDSRILAPRLVAPDELPAIYAASTLLVQPRQVDQLFVRYSFPSKLIEYMASGTPVVSTRLPSIPADYETFAVWSGDTAGELAEALRGLLTWTSEARDSFGAQASSFIRGTRGIESQGRRIVDFLKAVER